MHFYLSADSYPHFPQPFIIIIYKSLKEKDKKEKTKYFKFLKSQWQDKNLRILKIPLK